MALNKGKVWEQIVLRDWKRSVPNSFILRIPDQQSGYFNSSNIADFIAFNTPYLFLIECKAVKKGNTINFAELRQYPKLINYIGIKNVNSGFLIWFQEKNIVIWARIEDVVEMIKKDKKSINIKMLEDKEYHLLTIPIKLKIKYPVCDFSILIKNISEVKDDNK